MVWGGKAGFSSDPLKRLENRIGVLFSRCRTFLDQAEANKSHAYIRWVHTLVIWVVATQIFLFHPEPWANDAIWRTYFLDWLKPPTSCCSMLFSHHWWLVSGFKLWKPKTLTAWTTPPHQFRKKGEVGSWNWRSVKMRENKTTRSGER